jgi:Asp-tRNA(Asn)/Glu-tRNA(Gln) amidotransferase B subunit
MGVESESVVTVVRLGLDGYVDAVIASGAGERGTAIAVRRLANEVAAEIGSAAHLTEPAFCRLIAMESDGSLTTAQARTVLRELLDNGGEPDAIAARLGFEAMEAGDLEAVVDQVISAHPDEWSRYVAGEAKLAGFFMNHIKAATEGKADMKAASALLRSRSA